MVELKAYTQEDIDELNALLAPEQKLALLREKQFAESKKYTMTRDDIIHNRLIGTDTTSISQSQGGVEFANLIEASKVKGQIKINVYDGTLGGSLDVSTLPDGLRDIYSAPKVTKIVIDPNFDLYNYPLAVDGNYFIPFNTNSKNADIAAFSKDVLRLTGAADINALYELLKLDDWRDLIKDAFNIGRGYEDYIDIIYDINIGTYDFKPIAFVAKLKYLDPAKQTLPEYFNNRVFIGFKKPGYTSEPGERLQELADDAYIFLESLPNGPIDPAFIDVSAVAAYNTRKLNQLNGKIEAEVEKVVAVVDEVKQEIIEPVIEPVIDPYNLWIPTFILAGVAVVSLVLLNHKLNKTKGIIPN